MEKDELPLKRTRKIIKIEEDELPLKRTRKRKRNFSSDEEDSTENDDQNLVIKTKSKAATVSCTSIQFLLI